MNTQALLTPNNAMNRVRYGVDRLFESMVPSFVRNIGLSDSTLSGPALNVIEDDNRLYVEAELPGVALSDIEITVADNTLTISGSRTLSSLEDANALRQERGDFVFERSVTLSTQVEVDAVEARMTNGVLRVTLPKVIESRTRRIAVTQD
ncbi:MAG: Hsp20/alpha crystallin family protein [Phycisphaerales bacterium]|nr:Hsp20/alpha crystallin family protein [Phycisphaerales bacterium]